MQSMARSSEVTEEGMTLRGSEKAVASPQIYYGGPRSSSESLKDLY